MNPFNQKKKNDKQNQPQFVLTDCYPVDGVGEELLGRVVANYSSPLDDYCPSDPRPALGALARKTETIDTNFSSLLSVERNKTVAAKIGHILNIDIEKQENEKSNVISKIVRTRRLEQHFVCFQALLKKHEKEVVDLTRRAGGVAYMVVGFKSCLDGFMGKGREVARNHTAEVTAPVGLLSTAASHGVVNIGDTFDSTVGHASQASQTASTQATMVGERIFAVRYRVLTLRKNAIRFQEKDFGHVLRAEPQHGVYGAGDDDAEELVLGDDVSDIDEGEGDAEILELDNTEELVLGGEPINENESFIVDVE